MSTQTAPGELPTFDQPDYLRKAREHRGLKQSDLADLMGVDVRTIRNAEAGKPVRRVTLLAWSMVTGVPVEWLQTGRVRHQGLEPQTRWLRRRAGQQVAVFTPDDAA